MINYNTPDENQCKGWRKTSILNASFTPSISPGSRNPGVNLPDQEHVTKQHVSTCNATQDGLHGNSIGTCKSVDRDQPNRRGRTPVVHGLEL